MINITKQLEEGVEVINVVGDVDASSSIELDNAINESVNGEHKKIIIDCSNLNYISSAGLGVFMSYIEDIEAKDIKMVICGLNEKVENVFQILGLDQLLKIVKGKKTALKITNQVFIKDLLMTKY